MTETLPVPDAADDVEDRCSDCCDPAHPDDLVRVDDQSVCFPCAVVLLGDDLYAPDHGRDL